MPLYDGVDNFNSEFEIRLKGIYTSNNDNQMNDHDDKNK